MRVPRKQKKFFKKWIDKAIEKANKEQAFRCLTRGHQLKLVPEINTKEKVCMACGKLESEIK